MTRAKLLSDLESAQNELRSFMGGVDPHRAIITSKRITELRHALRDGSVLVEHFAASVTGPLVPRKQKAGRIK